MTYHRQCLLQHEERGTYTTSWIPERGAKRGKKVKLKGDDGQWDSGWEVRRVGLIRVKREDIHDDEYRKHRREYDV